MSPKPKRLAENTGRACGRQGDKVSTWRGSQALRVLQGPEVQWEPLCEDVLVWILAEERGEACQLVLTWLSNCHGLIL